MTAGLRRWLAQFAIFVMFVSGVVAIPATHAEATIQDDAAAELATFAVRLAETATLAEMTELIPGVGGTLGEAIGFIAGLEQLVANLTSGAIATEEQLRSAIDSADGEGFTFESVNVASSGGLITGSFDLAIARTASFPIAVQADGDNIIGGNVDLTVATASAATINFEYDTSLSVFAITSTPTIGIDVSADAATVAAFPEVFGFTDISVSGTASVFAHVDITPVDPDADGRITDDEITATIVEDLFSVDLVDVAGKDAIDVGLTFTATIDAAGGPVSFGGSLSVTDASLATDPVAETTFSPTAVGLQPLDLLDNTDPNEIIGGLARLTGGLGAMMGVGDVQLPFLEDGVFFPSDLEGDFDKFFAAIQPLIDYVDPIAAGQIVCGSTTTEPETGDAGIPIGSIDDIVPGDSIFCRAYTAVDPEVGSTVTWIGVGTDPNPVNGDSLATVGVSPSANVEFVYNGGAFDASVTYEPEALGETVQVNRRPETLQRLITELLETGLISGVTYDAATSAVVFEFSFSEDLGAHPAELDYGDRLLAETGLLGIEASSSTLSVDIGTVSTGIGFGVFLVEDVTTINPSDNTYDPDGDGTNNFEPGTEDRFFVALDAAQAEMSVAGLSVSNTDFALAGRLGFLEISAGVVAGSEPGTANTLAAFEIGKVNAADPVLELDLALPASPPGGIHPATGVTVGAAEYSNAVLIRHLLADPGIYVDAAANLSFESRLEVSASVEGTPAFATGVVGVRWDNVTTGSPVITTDGGFNTELLPFDLGRSGAHDGGSDEPFLTDSTVPAAESFLGSGSLLGATLYNETDGSMCTIDVIPGPTTVGCALQGGAENDWDPGDDYLIRGDITGYLTQILNSLEGLIDELTPLLESQAAWNEPLPVIGLSPNDLVSQINELRMMIDEFRGIQAATISCVPVGGDDIRNVPADGSGGGSITCSATAAVAASTATWWIGADASATQSEPTSVGPAPAGSVTLSIPSGSDTDGDGFIALGAEYAVVLEFSNVEGDHHIEFPAPDPRSLQDLRDAIANRLGIDPAALVFELDDLDGDSSQELILRLGYGICSDPAPSAPDVDCDAAATVPAPAANINVDLGDAAAGLVGLEITGDVDVSFGASAQLDLAIPLNGNTPLVLDTTGFAVAVDAGTGSDPISLTANVGPISLVAGGDAKLTGTRTGGADGDSVEDSGVTDFATLGLKNDHTVANTTQDAECAATAVAGNGFGCDLPDDWANGDGYQIGGVGRANVGASVTIDVDTGVLAYAPITGLSFNAPAFTGLGTADNCGTLPAGLSTQVVGTGGDYALDGIGCMRLSLGLGVSGNIERYLGDLGLNFDPADTELLQVYVPADLEAQLAAAVLDITLLFKALPELLDEVEGGLNAASAEISVPLIGDTLDAGADVVGVVNAGVVEPLLTNADFLALLETFSNTSVLSVIESDLKSEIVTLVGDLLVDTDADGPDADDITVGWDCGGPCGDLTTTQLLSIEGVEVTFGIGQSVAPQLPFDLGLDGLPFRAEGTLQGEVAWSADVGIGLSRNLGPYILLDTGSGAELEIEANLSLGDSAGLDCSGDLADSVTSGDFTTTRCFRGKLGFLELTALDGADDGSDGNANNDETKLGFSLGLDFSSSDPAVSLSDLLAGDLNVAFAPVGTANVDLHFRTGLAGDPKADFPSVLGTFHAGWDQTDGFDVAFADLHLDIGAFLAKLVAPTTKEIKRITSPLQPVVDTVTAPIPVLSELSELTGGGPITMLTLLEESTGADLSLIKTLAAMISFINTFDPSAQGGQIALGNRLDPNSPDGLPGGFQINTAQAGSSMLPQDAAKLINTSSGYQGGDNLAKGISGAEPGTSPDDDRPQTFGVPGLSFPFLGDASQVFGVLVGADATLIRWDAGTLKATAGIGYDFGPIFVGPIPVTVSLGGSITLKGRFAIGYDTSGIRKVLDGGSGVYLFDGIFIDDLNAAGEDVPEVALIGRVTAGAAIDLVIVSAGARGGIELTVELDLDDRPEPDGKLRIEEIINKLQNPICLFIISGYLEAFLEVFVEVDLFLVSKEFAFELARVRLLDFEGACSPPAPLLAHVEADGTLVLHMGLLASTRNIAVETEAEDFTVRQIGAGRVTVSAFGIQQEFPRDGEPAITKVQADAGTDDDTVTLAAGNNGSPPTPDTLVPFVINSVLNGGEGSDQLTGGDGVDTINGGSGNDAISGGKGNDIIDAGPGNDAVDGSFGTDHIFGGDGIDRISGGPGGDVLLGGDGDDSIDGGPGGASGPEADQADRIAGNGGSDVVNGGFGDDIIFGDDPTVDFTGPVDYDWDKPDPWHDACGATAGERDTLNGQDGSDYIYGGGGNDGIIGGNDGDFACGDGGDDEIIGDGDDADSPGDDELRGGADHDELYGGDGHDLLMGDAGNDAIYGEADADDLIGGADRDLLFGDEGNDYLIGDDATIGGHFAAHAHAPFDPDAPLDVGQIAAVRSVVTLGADTETGGRNDCNVPDEGSGHADCLFGGNGSDFLFGVSSGDRMFGDAGADYLEGNAGDDTMRGGTQTDVMLGNAGGDTMFGDSGDDFMYGDRPDADPDAPTASGGGDVMRGGIGADHMEGDGGADTMNGDGQSDHMEGNGGVDTMNGDADDDIVIGGSDTVGVDDSGDALLAGGPGSDIVVGDNAVVAFGTAGVVAGRSVALIDPGIGGSDTIEGDAATDYLFGQRGNDTIYGDDGTSGLPTGAAAPDYIEGNDGDDGLYGEGGDDDIIGGSSAADGVIDADRQGNGLADGGESEMRGGVGEDWMAGDNARIDRVLDLDADEPDLVRLYDVRLAGDGSVPGGGDTMYGDDGTDRMFGQTGNDTMSGGDAPDYMEGNDGDDDMDGDDGDDDMIGGGSAADGVIDADRQGNGLADGGETLMSGGAGIDWMTGDNALIDRNVPSDAAGPIVLFDVETTSSGPIAGTGGGDTMHGNADDDEMFGQTGPDTMLGGAGDDYVEGNNGDDTVRGEDDDDLLIGGGSASDGIIVPTRVGDTLLDVGETLVSGGDGVDWMTGDNARILRSGDVEGLSLGPVRDLVLFDVQTVGGPAISQNVSGGDVMEGNNGADVIFGQGNGDQPSGQADPADGLDNDRDGRESPDSTEYDCADGFDIDGDGLVDGDDPHCADDIDEDTDWRGDIINGGNGDDYIEGNHGADWIFGDDDEDDIIGGGSANDGIIDTDRSGSGLLDDGDVIHGNADDDVVTGDNAKIARIANGGGSAWTRLDSAAVGASDFGPYDQVVRVTEMTTTPEPGDANGNDWIDGDAGQDELYGQLGDDFVLGDEGDDALIGDLGQVRANLLGDGVDDPSLDVAIDSQSPHWDAVINQTGALQWKTELYAFDSSADGAGGDDILLGYDGRDTAFGGPGDDVVAGDGDGGAEFPDAEFPEYSHITDPIAGRDIDFLFGGDDDDALWGGRDDDVLWGGHGDDYLDVRPREEGDNGLKGKNFAILPRDRAAWFTYASPESYHDVDFMYGGWDRDAFQADQAENGPDPGDRMADWAGGFNVFYLCPSGYGDHTIARTGSPHARAFLQQLSESNGAHLTASNGESGFRDLGYVFPNQRGQNSHPPHPDHVGHFACSP